MKNATKFSFLKAKQSKIVCIMKASLFLSFLILGTSFTVESYSQKTFFTLNAENSTIKEVFNEIEETSEYIFFYLDNTLDLNRKVSVKVKSQQVEKVLDQVFKGTNNQYHIADRQIIISKKDEAPIASPTPAPNQAKTITGRVSDALGPVVGANIIVKGTSNGTITDLDGNFSLSNIPNNAVIQITYIGYLPQEIVITNQTRLSITLKEDAQTLDELVVIGYGSVKKSDLTGSVSSVKSEDLNRTASHSPVSALQGRAAGVSVIVDSGSPEAAAEIQIRGIGTPNNTSPLYVVDGFPMSDITYLNPNDIESIEILKDASATAIYGSRGANGVVLVTTKKGKEGALKVGINAYFGIESLSKKTSMLNAKQYANLSNTAYENANATPPYANPNNPDYNTNWWDEVSQMGQVQSYTLNLSGGSDRITSLFSFNYFDRKGIVKSTDFDRLTFMLNNTMKVTSFFTLTTSLSGTFSDHKSLSASSVYLSSLMAPPDIPVIDPATDYYTGITKIRLANPAGRIARNSDENSRNYLIGNFNANIDITKDLSFSSRFGIRYNGTYNIGFSPVYYETMDNSNLVNTVTRSTSKMTDWTWENILTYRKTFKEIHDLTVMGAMSAREYDYDAFDASKQNTPNEQREFWYFNSTSDNPLVNGTGNALSMLSYLGRINYNLLDRYLITASFRADGSSRFIDSNRWGYFPSGAVAWKISEENFFKNLKLEWLSSAKLRFGYGQIGNENISGYYPYNTPISQRQYYTLGDPATLVNGALPSGIGNKEAKWETSTQMNYGLDLSLFQGKLSLVAEYFIRKSDDILLSQSIPRISGFNTMTRNVGGMENKGFEFTVGYKDSKGDFSYNVSANATFIKNKVTNLGTSTALNSSFSFDNVLIDFSGAFPNIIRTEVDHPYRQFYGYVTDGIFQNQAEIDAYTFEGAKIQADAKPGDFKFEDRNNNGRIDTGDMTFIGNPIPDVTYGFSFDASYKNFDISTLFQGVAGIDIFNASKYYFVRFDGRQNVSKDALNKYWTGENTSNKQPIVTSDATRNSRNYRPSDYYVEDGSYLRLKNIQLGYTFKPNLGSKLRPSVRVYLASQNLFTITKYSGSEVEISGNSVDRGQYPQPRTFMVGTVVNF